MTCRRMHHSRANIKFLDIKRENGKRGLVQLQNNRYRIKEYLDTWIDWMLGFVNTHE